MLSLRKSIDILFEEKRVTMALVTVWLIATCIIFSSLGAFHMQFMTLGPSAHTVFMGMVIDDWYKWCALSTFSFLNTGVNEFLDSALSPWFLNTVQDHKTKFLPYSKLTCLVITQVFTVYSHIMSVFWIFLFFSQLDFLLIRLLADLIVTHYVTYRFMENKTVDALSYTRERCTQHAMDMLDENTRQAEGVIFINDEEMCANIPVKPPVTHKGYTAMQSA